VGECYSLIAAEKTSFRVALMCRVFGVSRTGFHNWERRAVRPGLTDAWLTEKIRQIYKASRGVYGARRVHAELRLEHNVRVGRKRVARLMKAAGISGVRLRKRWKTTIRIPGITPATDRVERQSRPNQPNVLWVADITYLRTGEAWLYLAAVQDADSRQIVGWSMATHMRASLVVDALKMALSRRRPAPGVIHHSDQGSQGRQPRVRARRARGRDRGLDGLPRRRVRRDHRGRPAQGAPAGRKEPPAHKEQQARPARRAQQDRRDRPALPHRSCSARRAIAQPSKGPAAA
jgi:putative transposase